MTINELIEKFKYKKLSPELSLKQRNDYLQHLPSSFLLNGDNNCELYYNGIKVSNGYTRIVIGDYGAYIEISPEQIIKNNLMIMPGQEYRFSEKYKNIKYYWYCLKQNCNIKIYLQKNTVTYADYKIGMYYIASDNIEVRPL